MYPQSGYELQHEAPHLHTPRTAVSREASKNLDPRLRGDLPKTMNNLQMTYCQSVLKIRSVLKVLGL